MATRNTLLLVLAAAAPFACFAQEARPDKWVNVRAGPSRDYPWVASVGPGTRLAVQGCTAGYGWCDVSVPGGLRGWVYAGNIVFPYQGSQVQMLGYGAAIGVPIVTFTIGNYWGRHYRGRPWYGTLPSYQHSHPRPRPPAFGPPPGWHPPGRPPGAGGPPHGGGHRLPHGMRPPGHGRPPGDRPGRWPPDGPHSPRR